MSLRRFLYYILKEDGRSGKVVNGVVTYTGIKTPLPQTPDGWQEMQIGWERSLSDHGLIRSFSMPWGYVLNGAKIIRDALYNQSIEEKIFLLIQTLTLVFVPGVSYNWLYQYLYKGEIDLTDTKDTVDMVSVPCMEGGLHKLIKANRATKYTYPFDLDAINIRLDGIALQENAHYVVAGALDNNTFNNTHTLPISFVNKEGTSTGTAFFTQQIESIGAPTAPYVASSTNYFIINSSGASRTYNIKGTVRYICTENTAGLSYRWFLFKNDDTNQDVYNSITNPVVGATVEVPVDINFTLLDGERMFFVGRFFGAGGVTIAVDFLEGSELNVTFESTGATSHIKGYLKSTMFAKLVGSATGDAANAKSDLCLEKNYIVLTSGDAIRGLSTAEITTSLDEFKDDMDSTFMAGLAVANGKVEIERRQRYYDNSSPVNLGNLKNVEFTPATDRLCNRFKAGHPKPDIEDINGKYDPNGSAEFTGPITKLVKDYEIISPYKAGPYEIESLRLNLEGKVTTDDNRDSSVYVINCVRHNIINANVNFSAALNAMIITSAEFLMAGQQIEISYPSAPGLNAGIYNITDIASFIFAQAVILSSPVVDEAGVDITITILRGEVLTLNRPAYTQLEGVPNDTIFNLPELTPVDMLRAHGAWIRSMHKGLETGKLKFDSGNSNTKLLTELAGVVTDQDADISISSMADPMFIPIIATFETEVPVDLVDILEADPNRCFTGFDVERGVQIEIFLDKAGFAPNDLKEQEFSGLLTPNNDLSLLV